MMDLLLLKEKIRMLYQRSELYFGPLLKFFSAVCVFLIINNSLGYNEKLNNGGIILLLSLLCAFTPLSIMVLLSAVVMMAHVYAISQILSIIVILILAILYFLFARFTPSLGYVILLLPILFVLKIPYVVPILLGMIATPVAIVPAACGIIVYYLIKVIKEAAEITTNTSVENTLELYRYVVESLVNNKEMVFTIVVFAIVILITYFVRKMSFDHAFDIAIVTGVITNVFGFLIGGLGFNASGNVGFMILGSIASGVIVYIIQFFRLTLDYTGVERVQFEDDDYYYYVKVVPKINITAPKKDVKRFSGTKVRERISDKDFEEQEYDPFDDIE